MSQLSLHQRIVNAAASQEVENVKARHTYYHGRRTPPASGPTSGP